MGLSQKQIDELRQKIEKALRNRILEAEAVSNKIDSDNELREFINSPKENQ